MPLDYRIFMPSSSDNWADISYSAESSLRQFEKAKQLQQEEEIRKAYATSFDKTQPEPYLREIELYEKLYNINPDEAKDFYDFKQKLELGYKTKKMQDLEHASNAARVFLDEYKDRYDTPQARNAYNLLRDLLSEVGVPEKFIPQEYDPDTTPAILGVMTDIGLRTKDALSLQLREQNAKLQREKFEAEEEHRKFMEEFKEKQLAWQKKQFELTMALKREIFEHTKQTTAYKATLSNYKNLQDFYDDIQNIDAAVADRMEVIEKIKQLKKLLSFLPAGKTFFANEMHTLLPGTYQSEAVVLFNYIKSNLQLAKRGILKGTGAISNYEQEIAARAATILSEKLTKEKFDEELDYLIKKLSDQIVWLKGEFRESLIRSRDEIENRLKMLIGTTPTESDTLNNKR